MHTVTYTNTDGNVMKLLLTFDAEFERGFFTVQRKCWRPQRVQTINKKSDIHFVNKLSVMVIHAQSNLI